MKKTTMLFVMLFLSLFATAFQVKAQDTIRVEIGTKTQLLIYAQDREALRNLSQVDLNEIVRQVTEKIDSTESVVTYEYKNAKSQITLEKVGEMESKDYEEADDEGFRGYYPTDYDYRNRWDFSDPDRESFRGYAFFRMDIGLNNYVKDGQLVEEDSGLPYELSFLSSRYFSMAMLGSVQMGGSRSPMHIRMGLELSWYNFMLRGSQYMVRGENAVEFRNYQQDFGKSLEKNKLVAAYLSIPLTVSFEFKDRSGNSVAHFGFGGYAGYRVQSYFSTRTESNDRNKDRNSFYLNNIRYGLEAELGFGGLNFFMKYDFNPLFQDEKAPKLNAVSFGIRI